MNKVPGMMAWRFLKAAWHERTLSLMLGVCFVGIFLSTFSLTLVVAIMQGFERVTYEKIKGIHADLIIRAPHSSSLSFEKIQDVIKKDFATSVQALSPYRYGHALLSPHNSQEINHPVMIIGINPTYEEAMLLPTILQSKRPLQELMSDKHSIILGKVQAESFGVEVGDQLDLFYLSEELTDNNKSALELARESVIVADIFSAGVEDVDANVMYVSEALFEQLFPQSEVREIGLRLLPKADLLQSADILHTRLQLPIISWKDLYPSLVSALVLERYAMFFVITLITLVASMNIMSLLFMYILHKQADIAILKSMGMRDSTLIMIFIIIGMGLALGATLCGLISATFVCLLLNVYPFITLPDVYYATHLPADLSLFLVISVVVVALLTSFIASIIPSWRIQRISVAQVLKFEA